MEDNLGGAAGAGLMVGIFGVMCLVYLAAYLFFSFCLFKIAKKCCVDNAWLAWVPIVQIVPMLQSGGKPIWWIILFFIPLVNIVMGVLVWMGISERRGKPSWIGILVIVPIIGLFVPIYLAFSE